jgi:hypothetical protein
MGYDRGIQQRYRNPESNQIEILGKKSSLRQNKNLSQEPYL